MTTSASSDRNIERVWDIIEKAGICMLTTSFAGGLRSRPLEARPDRDAGLAHRRKPNLGENRKVTTKLRG
jgi:hypothetical protein